MAPENPFKEICTSLPKPGGGEFGKFYSLPALNDPRIDKLPYSIRILLESAIRNCDNFQVTKGDVEKIIDWENTSPKQVEIPFKPSHVLLQDFTGVPAVVDLACMRDAMNNLGGHSNKINPLGFAIPKDEQEKVVKFSFHGQPAELKHGSVVITAITSCTNTSNPSVMLRTGLVAKKACELGLEVVQSSVLPEMFKSTYEAITKGNPIWNQLSVPSSSLFSWDPKSTYIHEPMYFKGMTMDPPGPHGVKDAYYLINLGDSITTDHISLEGSIHKDSPAVKYLLERGVDRKDFNSYGIRRGNDEVMARGTFANIRIVNKLLNGEVGPKTGHIPTWEKLYVFDATMRYKNAGQDTIVLAGAEYGSGSSRD